MYFNTSYYFTFVDLFAQQDGFCTEIEEMEKDKKKTTRLLEKLYMAVIRHDGRYYILKLINNSLRYNKGNQSHDGDLEI